MGVVRESTKDGAEVQQVLANSRDHQRWRQARHRRLPRRRCLDLTPGRRRHLRGPAVHSRRLRRRPGVEHGRGTPSVPDRHHRWRSRGHRRFWSAGRRRRTRARRRHVRPAELVLNDFGLAQAWTSDRHLRFLADVTGAGTPDIVGFGEEGVWVAHNRGDGRFEQAQLVCRGFGYNDDAGAWRVGHHPRFLADITGDGRVDIGGPGVYVARNLFRRFRTRYPRRPAAPRRNGAAQSRRVGLRPPASVPAPRASWGGGSTRCDTRHGCGAQRMESRGAVRRLVYTSDCDSARNP